MDGSYAPAGVVLMAVGALAALATNDLGFIALAALLGVLTFAVGAAIRHHYHPEDT